MSEFPSLKNQLLIATPALEGSVFQQSVAVICEHNKEGALGIVINRPMDFSTCDLLEYMDIPSSTSHNLNPVVAGGPVQTDRGFVIHRSKKSWNSSICLKHDIMITTSNEILQAISHDELDQNTFIALGYAGWEAGQLEEEIIHSSWLTIPLDPEIIFHTAIENRWQKSIQSLNINLANLSPYTGNA